MKTILGIIIVFISLFFSLGINAQFDSPVTWEFEVTDEPNVMGLYEITFTATIEENWHMYSQHLPSPDDGPLPTIFTFDTKEGIDTIGNVIEDTKPKSVFDDVFEVQVNYFDGKAIFKQLVGIADKKKEVVVSGVVSFMVCNNSTCLPPEDVPFSLTIKP